MSEENKKRKCYNCIHSSKQFKVGKLTHVHCYHPKYEEGLNDGTYSAWDTLEVFSNTCNDHEFKPKITKLI